MQLEFDPDKDAINRKEHGLSLAEAARFDYAAARYVHDTRYDYGEVRFQALGQIDDRLHVLVLTMRENVVRAISLRKANPREVENHRQFLRDRALGTAPRPADDNEAIDWLAKLTTEDRERPSDDRPDPSSRRIKR